jgi:phage terminase small subunit
MQQKKAAIAKKIVSPRNVRELRASLDVMQRAFVREYVRCGGYGPAAAMKAGYSNPREAARDLEGQPAISLAIRAEQIRVVGGELASCAVRTILTIMRDETIKPETRLNGARLALEASRMIGRAAIEAPRERPIAEMSTAELDAMLAETQSALSALQSERRTIEHKPPASDTQSDVPSSEPLAAQALPARHDA